ncbi:leucyl/phenylalanyl-tRNA--protein transferase [Flavobacteriaceae bacterium R38]|nr:leucyl/phenylalanyl-tRNA--protein transferase [Flavobacteriaceae bacterium R38]
MFYLTNNIEFPPVHQATKEGIVAVGGDLSTDRLLLAYKSGIFPWFEEDSIILWWSPDPRMVLFPEKLKVSKSMKKILKKDIFKVTFNTCFEEVISNCAKIKRDGQEGTWITNEMKKAYCKLHEMGYAKSVEVWQNDELVGGLYGIDIPPVFCGESMFTKVDNASKIAFIHLVENLKEKDYKLIDCQVYTDHLSSLGAEEIPRDEFIKLLNG